MSDDIKELALVISGIRVGESVAHVPMPQLGMREDFLRARMSKPDQVAAERQVQSAERRSGGMLGGYQLLAKAAL